MLSRQAREARLRQRTSHLNDRNVIQIEQVSSCITSTPAAVLSRSRNDVCIFAQVIGELYGLTGTLHRVDSNERAQVFRITHHTEYEPIRSAGVYIKRNSQILHIVDINLRRSYVSRCIRTRLVNTIGVGSRRSIGSTLVYIRQIRGGSIGNAVAAGPTWNLICCIVARSGSDTLKVFLIRFRRIEFYTRSTIACAGPNGVANRLYIEGIERNSAQSLSMEGLTGNERVGDNHLITLHYLYFPFVTGRFTIPLDVNRTHLDIRCFHTPSLDTGIRLDGDIVNHHITCHRQVVTQTGSEYDIVVCEIIIRQVHTNLREVSILVIEGINRHERCPIVNVSHRTYVYYGLSGSTPRTSLERKNNTRQIRIYTRKHCQVALRRTGRPQLQHVAVRLAGRQIQNLRITGTGSVVSKLPALEACRVITGSNALEVLIERKREVIRTRSLERRLSPPGLLLAT